MPRFFVKPGGRVGRYTAYKYNRVVLWGERVYETGMMNDSRYWLIYDGDCELCQRVAVWVRQRDAAQQMRIVPYQTCPNPPLTPALYAVAERGVVLFHPDGRMERYGRAAMRVLLTIGYWSWLARLCLFPPLSWGVALGYRLVADNREVAAKLLFRTVAGYRIDERPGDARAGG